MFKKLMVKEEKIRDVMEKFNLTNEKIKELEKEQIKLSKLLTIKDSINFDLAEVYAGVENIFKGNRIISAIILMKENEIIEQKYVTEKVNFPYLSGFRAYRELPAMIKAFDMLEEKPDLIFVRASGIIHKKGLGLASHFSLSVNVPVIGISEDISIGEIKGKDIIFDKKILGKVLQTKKEANPLYVSPGNLISIETAEKLTKKLTTEPRKFPDVLIEAKKYAKKLLKEVL
jgi:deoxyribonuclease V